MGTTVSFGPINCGVIPPAGTATQSTQCAPLSASANVTASISDDTSGGAIALVSLASFVTEIKIVFPDPGEFPRERSR